MESLSVLNFAIAISCCFMNTCRVELTFCCNSDQYFSIYISECLQIKYPLSWLTDARARVLQDLSLAAGFTQGAEAICSKVFFIPAIA